MTSVPSRVGLRIDNKYLIEAEIGSGGMATVYRASRLLIGDSVAIKVLHPGQVDDRQSVERFRREAQAAARLKHANVVPIYDFGVSSDGFVYLVMELVEGKSVRDLLREQGSFAPRLTVEIITEVCSALEAAHKKNVVHRDVKPDNIVVDTASAGVQVKVLDFGIAWMRDIAASSLTETGNIVGTPHYMSPEQCLGEEPDPRSDLYSVGVVLFEMLTGVLPFNARTSTAVAIQHVNERPPSLRTIKSNVPPAVEAVVMRALAKQRDQRPQSAALLAAELAGAVAANADRPKQTIAPAPNVATTVKMPMPDWKEARQQASSSAKPPKSRTWLWASAAGLVALGIVAVYLTDAQNRTSTVAPNKAPSVVFSNNGPPETIPVAPQQTQASISDPTVVSRDTTQPPVQQSEGERSRTQEIMRAAGESAVKASVGHVIASRTASKQGVENKAPANTTPAKSRDLPVRIPASTSSTATNSVVPAAPPQPAPTATVDAPKADLTKSTGSRDLTEKETVRSNPLAPKPNFAVLAGQAVSACLSALRANSAERMSQLYQSATGQDRVNREKLLARMKDASSHMSVIGSADIDPAQIFDDSAFTDLLVHLSWRGNFGQTVNKTPKFRATIARTEGDSHISCRIIGKADL